MGGNHNRFLWINLTNGTVDIKSMAPEDLKMYMGGSALAAKMFMDDRGHQADPLSPGKQPVPHDRPPGGNQLPRQLPGSPWPPDRPLPASGANPRPAEHSARN